LVCTWVPYKQQKKKKKKREGDKYAVPLKNKKTAFLCTGLKQDILAIWLLNEPLLTNFCNLLASVKKGCSALPFS
jgi:hypothetical protein